MNVRNVTWSNVEQGHSVVHNGSLYRVMDRHVTGGGWLVLGLRLASDFQSNATTTHVFRPNDRTLIVEPDLDEALAIIRRELGDDVVII